MRLATATPRLIRPQPPARELQRVRDEAQRQLAAPAVTGSGAGLSGAVSTVWDATQDMLDHPALPGTNGSVGEALAPIKERLLDWGRRLGEAIARPGAPDWETGLPPVAPQPIAPQQPTPPASDVLKRLTPEQLTRLGATDKQGFFAALRPAAEEAERTYGVPAAVIMAQAALETGWAKHIIPGYNLFGHKGTGPAGTVTKRTWEVINGETVWIDAGFAKYHNFYEAVAYAGKRYHNGYYDKAVANYAKYQDPERFARDITGIYATDPAYGDKLITIMRQYELI